MMNFLWNVRDIPRYKMVVSVNIYGARCVKIHTKLFDIPAAAIALFATLYLNLVDKPWWLINLFGFSYSYSVLQILSPTSFVTGSLVLVALFFYDIYFVFFT